MKQAFNQRYLISFFPISPLFPMVFCIHVLDFTPFLRHFVRTDAVGGEMGRTCTVCLLYRTNQLFSIGRTGNRKKNATDCLRSVLEMDLFRLLARRCWHLSGFAQITVRLLPGSRWSHGRNDPWLSGWRHGPEAAAGLWAVHPVRWLWLRRYALTV